MNVGGDLLIQIGAIKFLIRMVSIDGFVGYDSLGIIIANICLSISKQPAAAAAEDILHTQQFTRRLGGAF